MNPSPCKPLSEAQDPDLRASYAAMLRAARMAREIAIQTNTAIIVKKDGKIVRITADELRREAQNDASHATLY